MSLALRAGTALPLAAGSSFTFDGAGTSTFTTVKSGAGCGSVLTKMFKNGRSSVTHPNSNTGIVGAANGRDITIAGLSAASTFAVCQVAARLFRTGKNLITDNVERGKEACAEALEKGKKFVQSLKERGVDRSAEALSETLTQLAILRDKGLLTPEEFEAKQAAALETLDV